MSDATQLLDPCGCCETVAATAPAISNPPGLTVLSYRIATQPVFKARMKAALGEAPELVGLTARDDSDPAVALVDAWATVLDVLTFYEERIANEGYLRTAAERQSVYSLASEISYLPNPGRAADVMLAFQLDTSPGAPTRVPIPVGTRVQSLPDPNSKPQTFETVEEFDARAEWNVLYARRSVRQHLAMDETSVVLAGTSTLLRPGDGLLFVGHHREQKTTSEHWEFRVLETVRVDTVTGTTTVTWSRGLGHHPPSPKNPEVKKVHPPRRDVHVYAMKTHAGIFGFNAPDWRNMPLELRKHYPTDATHFADDSTSQWPFFDIYATASKDRIDLDAVYPEAALNSFAVLAVGSFVQNFTIRETVQEARADYGLSSKVTRIQLDPAKKLGSFAGLVRNTVVHLQGPEVALADLQLTNPVQGKSIVLDRVIEGLTPGKALIVTGKRARAIVSGDQPQHLSFKGQDGTVVSLQQGESVQMTAPFTGDRSSGVAILTCHVRAPGGQEGTISALASTLRWSPALDGDDPIAELVTLEKVDIIDGLVTRLQIKGDGLANCYDRTSLKVNANVAHATHGETKYEVLGSGDASKRFQTFSLKQAPLTYVSSADPSGATTTLEVRVDDILWREVPTLFGTGPQDRVYVVRVAADGTVTLEFGDGITGARLPTGIENVKATYRIGTGAVGNVGPDRIKLLMTRPLGVQMVGNPVGAELGADAETIDSARANAPQQVVTFSRVVSLTDFEDFARAFAGIAKAQADWVWDGQSRTVVVTVAGVAGAQVVIDGDLYKKLKAAITTYADPHQRFEILSFDDRRFGMTASLFLEPGADGLVVVPGALSSLNDAFSFGRRSLGQPVFESEVISVLQATPGVMAVDLTALYAAHAPVARVARSAPAQLRKVTGPPRPPQDHVPPALPAHRGRFETQNPPLGINPAQLLTISPNQIDVQLVVAT